MRNFSCCVQVFFCFFLTIFSQLLTVRIQSSDGRTRLLFGDRPWCRRPKFYCTSGVTYAVNKICLLSVEGVLLIDCNDYAIPSKLLVFSVNAAVSCMSTSTLCLRSWWNSRTSRLASSFLSCEQQVLPCQLYWLYRLRFNNRDTFSRWFMWLLQLHPLQSSRAEVRISDPSHDEERMLHVSNCLDLFARGRWSNGQSGLM